MNIKILYIVLFFTIILWYFTNNNYTIDNLRNNDLIDKLNLQTGDLIFADGYTLVTLIGEYKSQFIYNHVAMVIKLYGRLMVIESDHAYGGVRMITIEVFINDPTTNKIGIRRRTTPLESNKLEKCAYKFLGLPYDWYSAFNIHDKNIKTIKDNKFTCTGLITKIMVELNEITIDNDYNYYDVSDFAPGGLLSLPQYNTIIEPVNKKIKNDFNDFFYQIIPLNIKLLLVQLPEKIINDILKLFTLN